MRSSRGSGAPLGRQPGEVREQFHRRGVDRRQLRRVVQFEDARDVAGDRPEALPVGLRYPDQLADHRYRQQVGEVVHEFDGRAVGSAFGHGVQQVIGHAGDGRLEPGHPARGKCARDQAPDPSMLGPVQVQDPVHCLDEHRVSAPAGEAPVEFSLV